MGGQDCPILFLPCFEDILGILGSNFTEGLIGDVSPRLLGVSLAKRTNPHQNDNELLLPLNLSHLGVKVVSLFRPHLLDDYWCSEQLTFLLTVDSSVCTHHRSHFP